MFYGYFKKMSVDLEACLSGSFCSGPERFLRKKQISGEVMEKLYQVFRLQFPVGCNRRCGDSKEVVRRGGERR